MIGDAPKYSDRELQMFSELGVDLRLTRHMEVPNIYRHAVEKAFLEELRGPAVDSLRRCYRALQSCRVYRLTPEWDEMIRLYDFVVGE